MDEQQVRPDSCFSVRPLVLMSVHVQPDHLVGIVNTESGLGGNFVVMLRSSNGAIRLQYEDALSFQRRHHLPQQR